MHVASLSHGAKGITKFPEEPNNSKTAKPLAIANRVRFLKVLESEKSVFQILKGLFHR